MLYIAVEWRHLFTDEPIRLFYEINDKRYEQRKVEEYRDGTLHFADATHNQGSTELSWEPFPEDIEEIAKDPQFRLKEITETQFNEVWNRALKANSK